MSENKAIKVDITSSAIENGLDIAKKFLEKLIMPTVEEVGLLSRDKIASWRLQNQIKILNRAKDKCQKNGISPKAISLKLLCPYLENASLEDDEYIQDKWAILLSNLIDSERNIQNHVFPYLLNQISKEELIFIDEKIDHIKSKKIELKQNILILESEQAKLEIEYETITDKFEKKEFTQKFNHMDIWLKKSALERLHLFSSLGLKPYELANLIRLGIIEKIYFHSASVSTDSNNVYESITLNNINIEIDTDTDYTFTELGNLFINICSESTKKK